MTIRPISVVVRLASLALLLILTSTGCSDNSRSRLPASPAIPEGQSEVVGTLLSVKDDRPADGGVDLTLETAPGAEVLVRVPSAFIAGPREAILAMHQVVDAAKIGDRLRARGTRDESGALLPETLELAAD